LKRLASIFAGAKQRKSKTILTPNDGIENTAPQRVQTTVSPPRVTMRRVYQKRFITGCYSFEVNIGMQSADRSTDNNQSAQRRKKNKSINDGTQI
jgi:hypothetical protein